MANNYTQFSDGISNITTEEAAWIGQQLEHIWVSNDGEIFEEAPDGLDPQVESRFEGPRWYYEQQLETNQGFADGWIAAGAFNATIEPESDGTSFIWFREEESGDPEQLADFVQRFLKRWRPTDTFQFSYACTCSKPRIGEFGGGDVLVTAFSQSWTVNWQLAATTLELLVAQVGRDEVITLLLRHLAERQNATNL